MVKEVCPTTPPYRHLAQFVAAYRPFLDGYGTDTIETRPIGPTDIGLWEAYYLLMACPTCLAAVGEQRPVNEEHTDRRLGQLAANVFYHSEVQTPGGAWAEIGRTVATEVLRDPTGWARELGLPDWRFKELGLDGPGLSLDYARSHICTEMSCTEPGCGAQFPHTAHQTAQDAK